MPKTTTGRLLQACRQQKQALKEKPVFASPKCQPCTTLGQYLLLFCNSRALVDFLEGPMACRGGLVTGVMSRASKSER